MIKKFVDLIEDVTIGFFKQYQSNAVDLAKIEAAALYLKIVKLLRDHFLIFSVMLMALLILAVAFVALPAIAVLCAPVAFKTKLLMLSVLALVDIALPLAFLRRFLSEETWLKVSKTDKVLEKVIGL
jgi:hypothetical protein